jgi:uncharacterized protein (DUF302 family)
MQTSVTIPSRTYGFGTGLSLPFDQAVERVKTALKEQGFGVLTEIDVRATMRQKLDVDFRPYVILGACNPPLAHRALTAELGLGLLLPCNVVVYANEDGSSSVEFMDPEAILPVVGIAALIDVAREAKARLVKVRDVLAAG